MMTLDFSNRRPLSERMEDPAVDEATLRTTLDDLAHINAVLGGYAPTLDGIEQLADTGVEPLSILDVGTGSGDGARTIADWARRRNIDLHVTGIDLSETTVEYARRRSQDYDRIEFQTCDLFEIPENQRFDIVHAALTLHHLDGDQAIDGLEKMAELSRLGVVVNDLHRHPLGYYGSQLVLRLLSDNPIIHHDGAVSFLRAFTRSELQTIARRAGLRDVDIRWWPLFRWQMIARREIR